MASLRYVVAVVLVTVLVYCSALHPLVRRLQFHVNSCSNETPECMHQCIFKKMGIVNKNGQYVERKAVEWMKIATDKKILTRSQTIKIAKTCNSVNKSSSKRSKGCHLAEQVSVCMHNEMLKVCS
ncbi:uncharacterized protein LOC134659454 [Cydia amplana]|uniref:uncharacterized protein LOC134659454 n=1 Tax=Cydia amplana TaxID=1869771 RepID=UPI002FE540FC